MLGAGSPLPSGLVTFLFTDIEGSTRRWDAEPAAMPGGPGRHARIVPGVVQELVSERLPPGAVLRDLGEHRLKDLQRPERVFELTHADLPGRFPPPRTLATRPNNLPLQRTALIGREREIAAAVARLRLP